MAVVGRDLGSLKVAHADGDHAACRDEHLHILLAVGHAERLLGVAGAAEHHGCGAVGVQEGGVAKILSRVAAGGDAVGTRFHHRGDVADDIIM